MLRPKHLLLLAPILSVLVWACGRPSTAVLETTREAVHRVRTPDAWEYAPDELNAALDALVAAEDELAAQRRRFPLLRSYEKASLLLDSAQQRAAEVPAAITAGKRAAREDSLRMMRLALHELERGEKLLSELQDCPTVSEDSFGLEAAQTTSVHLRNRLEHLNRALDRRDEMAALQEVDLVANDLDRWVRQMEEAERQADC